MLTKNEIDRYNRQILLPEIGLKGQEKLKTSSVLIIGVGGLGSPILQYLASAGIGRIGLVDSDTVDYSNLHRQIIYTTEDVGLQKVVAAKKRIEQANPDIKIIAINQRLNPENAIDLFKSYDLIIDGSDNFDTKYLVNDACVILNKPFVFGSIYRFQGQVSVFNFNNGPTYRCLFPDSSNLGSCAEVGVIGVLPGIIGSFMANEALKILLNFGDILSGKLLVVDTKTLSIQIHQFSLIKENKDVQTLIPSAGSCTNENEIEAEYLTAAGDDFVLIDVREPHEHHAYNIGGINFPLNSIQENFEQLNLKIMNDQKLIFYCKTGVRSKKATALAKRKGLKNSFSLRGGIDYITKK